jgi:rRNA-processing protein FCF1
MNRPISVVIPDAVAEKLAELARRQFRRPKDEASLLLDKAIERASVRAREPGPEERTR